MQNTKLKAHSAFTLVELIVVIVILSILSTIAFLSFSSQSSSARDSSKLADISSLTKGLELYQVNSGTYPLPENITGTGYINSEVLNYVGTIRENISRLLKINKTPVDSLNSNNYMYGVSYNQAYYQIGTVLENPIAFNYSNRNNQNNYNDNIYNYNNLLIPTTYSATANTYQSKVSGNYKGILKKNTTIYNLPSLLFSNTGSVYLTGTTVYFIANKSYNLPYKIDSTTPDNSVVPSDILTLVGASGASLSVTGINITDTSYWNTNSGIISTSIGYPVDAIGTTYYGITKYFNEIKTNTVVAAIPTEATYTIGTCLTSTNSARTGTTPTKAALLANISNYIGCAVTGKTGVIAGFTYSGGTSVATAEKMVLLSALTNTGTTSTWGNITDNMTMADMTGATNTITMTGAIVSWDGLTNTTSIISKQGLGSTYAAQKCNATTDGGQIWYLPATEELNELYCYNNNDATNDGTYYGVGASNADCINKGYLAVNKNTLTNFVAAYYWSSTERGTDSSRYQAFGDGGRSGYYKSNALYIRCVSRF